MFRKVLFAVVYAAVMAGCTFNVRIVKEDENPSPETMDDLKKSINHYAVLNILHEEFPCKILGINDENIVIANHEVVSQIPIKAVTQIDVYGSDARKGKWLGYVIGGVTGGFIGQLLARESGSGSKDLQIVGSSLGTVVGMVGFYALSGESQRTIQVNGRIKPYEFLKAGEKNISTTTIQQYSLFDDLILGAGETLLTARFFSYEQGKYLAVYEVFNGKDMAIRWKAYEEDYIRTENAKLQQPMKNQIFKNSVLGKE